MFYVCDCYGKAGIHNVYHRVQMHCDACGTLVIILNKGHLRKPTMKKTSHVRTDINFPRLHFMCISFDLNDTECERYI